MRNFTKGYSGVVLVNGYRYSTEFVLNEVMHQYSLGENVHILTTSLTLTEVQQQVYRITSETTTGVDGALSKSEHTAIYLPSYFSSITWAYDCTKLAPRTWDDRLDELECSLAKGLTSVVGIIDTTLHLLPKKVQDRVSVRLKSMAVKYNVTVFLSYIGKPTSLLARVSTSICSITVLCNLNFRVTLVKGGYSARGMRLEPHSCRCTPSYLYDIIPKSVVKKRVYLLPKPQEIVIDTKIITTT